MKKIYLIIGIILIAIAVTVVLILGTNKPNKIEYPADLMNINSQTPDLNSSSFSYYGYCYNTCRMFASPTSNCPNGFEFTKDKPDLTNVACLDQDKNLLSE